MFLLTEPYFHRKLIIVGLHHFLFFLLQLRNLVWATSKHDVYLLSNYSISHWSSLTGSRNEILNLKGHVAPSEVRLSKPIFGINFSFSVWFILSRYSIFFQRHPESLLEGFTETQVSTLAVKERLLVAGGFQGELICKVSLKGF